MGRKKTAGEFQQTSARIPREHYEVLRDLAVALGIDLAALMNLLIAEAMPMLRERLASHRRDLAALKADLADDREQKTGG